MTESRIESPIACPPWCPLEPGHPLEVSAHPSDRTRWHTLDVTPEGLRDHAEIIVQRYESPFAERMPQITDYVQAALSADETYTPNQARQIADALLKAADILDPR